jgi:hypothetical protein
MLWPPEALVRPAFGNLTYSHESRACRNGLLK